MASGNQFIEINPLLTSQLVKYTISMSKRWSISSVKKTYVCVAISLIGEIQGLNLVPNFPHEQKIFGLKVLSYRRNPSKCHVLLNNKNSYILKLRFIPTPFVTILMNPYPRSKFKNRYIKSVQLNINNIPFNNYQCKFNII